MPTDNGQNRERNPLPKLVADLSAQKDNQKAIVNELKETKSIIQSSFGNLSNLFNPEKQARLFEQVLSNTNQAIKSALNDVGSVVTSQIAQSPLLAGAFNFVKGLGADLVGMFRNKDEMTDDEKEKLADERAEKQVEATEQVGEKVEMLHDVLKPNEELRREQNVKDKRVIDTLSEIRDALSSKVAAVTKPEDSGIASSDSFGTGVGVFFGNFALKLLSGAQKYLLGALSFLFRGLAKAIPIAAVVGTLFSGLSDAIRTYRDTGNLGKAFESFGVGVLEFLTLGLVNSDNIADIQDWVSRKIIEPVFNFIDDIGEIFAAGWGKMMDKFKALFPELTAFMNEKFGDLFAWVERKWQPFKNLYESAVDTTSLGIEKFANWLEELRDGFNRLASFGLDFIKDTLTKISNFYANLFDQIVVGALSFIPDFVKDRFDSLKQMEQDAQTRIRQRLMQQQENISQKQSRPETLDNQTKEVQRIKSEQQQKAQAAIFNSATTVNNQKQQINLFGGLNSGALNKPAALAQ